MKPMLSGKLTDVENLRYPVLASPKLDGIRCLIVNGQPVSRNMKLIPNRSVQSIIGGMPAFDGELIVGSPTAADCFNRTSSGVMSHDGFPTFVFWVFDMLTHGAYGFRQRLELCEQMIPACGKNIQLVDHTLIKTPEALMNYEAKMVALGYEGIMVRDPDGPYKYGRSTEREGFLLKLKRFEDGEAVIVGFEEKEHNDNVRTTDELGRAKRSSHKSGKRAAGTLGALVVTDKETGVQFNIGTGFSESQRADIWSRRRGRGSVLGKLVKYRFQPVGVKEAPRFPTFLGFRDEADT